MIGIDLAKIERFTRARERHGDAFLRKFLGEDELALVRSDETAAGFWAVKEAASKALGCGICSDFGWHDVVIGKTPLGAPTITFSPRVLEKFGIKLASASISDDGGFAVAVVAIEI